MHCGFVQGEDASAISPAMLRGMHLGALKRRGREIYKIGESVSDYGFQLSTSTGTYLCIMAFNCLPLLELAHVLWLCTGLVVG